MEGIDSLGIKKLLYFHQIATNRTFRDAARNLGVSQPALTRHVQCLEEELGVVLIHRHASGNTLTEAGKILAEKTTELLAIISSTKTAIDDLRGDPSGMVTIGLSMGFAGTFLSSFLADFSSNFPLVQLRLMEGSTRHVEEWLHSSQAEIGIICLPFGSTQLVEDTLVREELFLISTDPAKHAQSVHFAELADMQMVLPLPRYGTRQLLDRIAAEHAITLRPMMEADNPNTIKQLVLSTGWSAIHSAMLFEKELAAGQVYARPILPAPVRGIALVTSHDKPLSTAARAIALALGKAVKERYVAAIPRRIASLKLAG
jgi:LysR family nitrogen assimilation transcriptional regulator